MKHSEAQMEKMKVEEPYHYELLVMKEEGTLPPLENLNRNELRLLCHDYCMPDSEIASLFSTTKDKVRNFRYALGLKRHERFTEDITNMIVQREEELKNKVAKLEEDLRKLKSQ